MSLTITPDLIEELADRTRTTRAALTLATDGWDVRVYADHPAPEGLTAMTAEGLYGAWMDGDGFDPDLIPMILAEVGDRHLDDEHGNPAAYPDGTDWCVVLPDVDAEDADPDAWASAWTFELGVARELVHGIHQSGDDLGMETGRDLWVTGGGRYVERLDDRRATHYGTWWSEVTAADAAEWMYRADDQEVAPGVEDPLMGPARAVRAVVDAVTPPVRYYDSDPMVRAAQVGRAADEDEPLVDRTRVLSDLLRTVALPDLRAARGRAVATVYEDEDRNAVRTALRLGISRQTIADLVAL